MSVWFEHTGGYMNPEQRLNARLDITGTHFKLGDYPYDPYKSEQQANYTQTKTSDLNRTLPAKESGQKSHFIMGKDGPDMTTEKRDRYKALSQSMDGADPVNWSFQLDKNFHYGEDKTEFNTANNSVHQPFKEHPHDAEYKATCARIKQWNQRPSFAIGDKKNPKRAQSITCTDFQHRPVKKTKSANRGTGMNFHFGDDSAKYKTSTGKVYKGDGKFTTIETDKSPAKKQWFNVGNADKSTNPSISNTTYQGTVQPKVEKFDRTLTSHYHNHEMGIEKPLLISTTKATYIDKDTSAVVKEDDHSNLHTRLQHASLPFIGAPDSPKTTEVGMRYPKKTAEMHGSTLPYSQNQLANHFEMGCNSKDIRSTNRVNHNSKQSDVVHAYKQAKQAELSHDHVEGNFATDYKAKGPQQKGTLPASTEAQRMANMLRQTNVMFGSDSKSYATSQADSFRPLSQGGPQRRSPDNSVKTTGQHIFCQPANAKLGQTVYAGYHSWKQPY